MYGQNLSNQGEISCQIMVVRGSKKAYAFIRANYKGFWQLISTLSGLSLVSTGVKV